MRTLLIEDVTEYSGIVLVFEPRMPAKKPHLRKDHPDIIFFESQHQDTQMLSISAHTHKPSSGGIMHPESLKTLFEKYPEYFNKIHAKAAAEKFVLWNSFVYETPDMLGEWIFPFQSKELHAMISAGNVRVSDYEKLYPIGGFKQYIEDYFKDRVGLEKILLFWNFCNAEPYHSAFKHFLSGYLVQKKQSFERTVEE